MRNVFASLTVALLAGSIGTSTPAFAQASAGRQSDERAQRFEVASIKRCADDVAPGGRGGGAGAGFSPGRLTLNCQVVGGLIQSAYITNATVASAGDPGLVYDTPIEGPDWIRSERYTIVAKAEDAASRATMEGPMLRALLEDRFKLRIRRGTRDVPIYELTVAKGGPKLTPFQEGSCVPPVITFPPTPPPAGQRYCDRGGRPGGPNRVLVQEGITIDQLCKEILSGNPLMGLGRRVVDNTGIAGRFVIHLEFAPPPVDPSRPELVERRRALGEPTAPSIFTAIQEQLGLKLEPARGRGEFLVIDRVERPSEN